MRTVAHLIQFVKTSLYASCLPQTKLVGACDKEGGNGDRRTGLEETISPSSQNRLAKTSVKALAYVELFSKP